MKRTAYCLTAVLSLSALLSPAQGQLLGTAQSFAVLGGSTVTNTGPTVITGSVGVWAGSAITGFPPGIVVGGTMHITDAAALQAQSDVTAAYNILAGMALTQTLTGTDLGGLTLTPGVYFFATSAFLTGTLTLDAQGNPDALFVFQIGSTLITASNSSVVNLNGADGCNTYWQVGSSATLGTDTAFAGNILAMASITLNTGASIIDGRALARTGAVTMDSSTISSDCIPTPGVAVLFGSAAIVTGGRRRPRA
jgi:type VI secretion system secreted protein VgrG